MVMGKAYNTAKQSPLLFEDKSDGRPLFMILVILAFLASLTLLATKTSYFAAAHWSAQLSDTATVQIKPGEGGLSQQTAAQARGILLQSETVTDVDILSQEQSKALLRPWLGDTSLPDDLPLPLLLSVRLKKGQSLDQQKITAQFRQAGIRADIDDHGRWAKSLTRSARMAQTISLLSLVLIIITLVAAAIFATRSGIAARRKFMSILHQIGANPNYTARLFSQNFALKSFKAGAIGALGAYLVLSLLAVLARDDGGASLFLPSLKTGLTDLYWVASVPVGMAIIAALTAWRTVMKTLIAEIYP